MAFSRFAQAQADLAKSVVPAFGAISLFWWAFTREFPDALKPFASPADGLNLMGGLLVNAVAALFFSRFIRVFLHYNLTSVRDIFFAKPRELGGAQKFRHILLRLNYIRRFLRRRITFIDVFFGVLLFSVFSFGELKFGLLFHFAFWSFVLLIGLLGISFRLPRGSYSIIPQIAPSVSSDRVTKVKLAWAVMSLLLFSLLFGSELREHRKKDTICIHSASVPIRASIILVTGDVVISVIRSDEGVDMYAAIPINRINRISPCPS